MLKKWLMRYLKQEIEEVKTQSYQDGYQNGRQVGYKEGKHTGYIEGISENHEDSILINEYGVFVLKKGGERISCEINCPGGGINNVNTR